MDSDESMKISLSEHGYEYIEHLGSGSFSSVHLCQCLKYNHQFAIKKVHKSKISVHEYNTLISLDHPNIIKLYVSFEDNDSRYLVMEYCQNGTIKKYGGLGFNKFVYYAKQILEALEYCHSKNIAHRDIKPDNIFVDKYDKVKLADFGLAKYFDMGYICKEKCGTLMFSSPELLLSNGACPFKTDIWALGITFFFMATGNYPFPNSSQDELRMAILNGDLNFADSDLDPRIRYLIYKMTSRNLKLRPSAKKLLQLPLFASTNRKISQSCSLLPANLNMKIAAYSTSQHRPKLYKTQSSRLDECNISHDNNTQISKIRTYRHNTFLPNVYKMNCQYHPNGIQHDAC